MTLQLTVSPDFSPDHIAGWYVFNTWLQRKLGLRCHLELYDDFERQHQAIAADQVDLIFANPYDASMLVRERGFRSLAAPLGSSDEALIAVAQASSAHAVTDLKPGLRVAQTKDPDVNLIGMIMLEPADLGREHVVPVPVSTYVLVAKHLLLGRVDAGFFLKQAFDDLSPTTRAQLRPLVTSQISVVRHALLAGPRFAAHADQLRAELLAMSQPGSDGGRVLEALGLAGWEALEAEDTEFMIDLMEALMR
ncbi:MAG: phosphate/phosphite/phosphonate ABC transporter substrate-binding protein [Rubrivivax sp.]|nr:phosphate/phosphite/phosphonate ABC transporter substrate-binding protein [Rubrivivax sp.]